MEEAEVVNTVLHSILSLFILVKFSSAVNSSEKHSNLTLLIRIVSCHSLLFVQFLFGVNNIQILMVLFSLKLHQVMSPEL